MRTAAPNGAARLFTAFVLYLIVSPTGAASGQNLSWTPPTIPADAAFYYRLDPSRFSAASAGGINVLPFALQLAERYGVIDADLHPIFDAILGAAIAGARPHTLCVLDADARFDEQARKGFQLESMRAVLALESSQDHRAYLQALGTILAHYGEESAGAPQTIFTLPDGRSAARFRAREWAEWQSIEWASLESAFVVGLGAGALSEWINSQNRDLPLANLDDHRRFVERGAAMNSDRFVEIWLNLDRLRARMPEIVAEGRVRDTLVAWRLDNARSWMLHGRWEDRFLLLDVTWQRRSEPAHAVAHRPLTIARWPDEISFDPTAEGYLAVFPSNHAAAFEQAVRGYRALRGEDRRAEVDRRLQIYRRRDRVYNPLWNAFEPYVILTGDPAPPVPIPGATTVITPLRRGERAKLAANRMDSLIELFFPNEGPPAPDEPSRQGDRASGLSWLAWDANGLFRFPVWGWTERAFVFGWGAPSIEVTRAAHDGVRRD
ncbi:MAG: hypothetical protein ACF8PN_01900 [Phycisphaerales bacterium]